MDDKELTTLLRAREQRGMDELLCRYGPMLRKERAERIQKAVSGMNATDRRESSLRHKQS